MKSTYPPRALALFALLAICTFCFAQAPYDGDMLISALGKTDQNSEVSNLKTSYNFQMANENHYLSKDGIELTFQDATLNEIKLYKHSKVYGNFTGRLPRGLRFDLNPEEVKGLLGKPSQSYNSGYCEFELRGQIISCWFENDRLSQIGLALK
jgi:hypothetical protein